MAETRTDLQEKAEKAAEDQKMCCEGGMTAEEHRKSSPDGKCCTD